MQSMGTAYYNGTLYKHRLPPLIEWQGQIWGPGGTPAFFFSIFLLMPKEIWPGVLGAGGHLKRYEGEPQ